MPEYAERCDNCGWVADSPGLCHACRNEAEADYYETHHGTFRPLP